MEFVQEMDARVVVFHRHCLGDLDLESLGRGSGPLHDSTDQIQHVPVFELPGGEIDGNMDIRMSVQPPGRDMLTGLGQDPLSDADD